MGFHVREAIYGIVKKRADKRDSLGIENWVVTARASNDKVIPPFLNHPRIDRVLYKILYYDHAASKIAAVTQRGSLSTLKYIGG